MHPHWLGKWTVALVQFIAMLEPERWHRRVQTLQTKTAYDEKIVQDRHWLESDLALLSSYLTEFGRLPDVLPQRAMAALEFAHDAVATPRTLTAAGQRVFAGRLRDGLNTGFADLYQELSMASQLRTAGWTVTFPDMDGTSRHDIDATRDGLTVCVECKTISADAGRKVHRRDFYRFAALVQPTLSRAPAPGIEALVVTMADRFPTAHPDHLVIADHIRQCIDTESGRPLPGPGFTVHREPVALTNGDRDQQAISVAIDHWARTRYGGNCHVAGEANRDQTRLLVVMSARDDDTSREALAARSKAATQLPPTKPGLVALQYAEIRAADLYADHFKDRLRILDNYFLHGVRAQHVIGVHHSAFDGLQVRHGRPVMPAAATARSEQHLALQRQLLGAEWLPLADDSTA